MYESLPSISIIIPAKDEQTYIGRCLDAVGELNYPKNKLEIIIVDNNSKDNTKQIASSYKGHKVLSTNGTISAVRNFGGKQSQSDFLAFLDSDCIPEKDWLLKATSILDSHKDVAVVGATLALEPSSNPPWIESCWLDYLNSKFENGNNYVTTISSFCFVVRRNIIHDVGWFNENLKTCEDSDLGYRISQNGSKLIITTDIKTIHLRNAKTPKEFFSRQLWQGGSNLQNFFQHKFEWDEIPSIAIPLGYLVLMLILPISVITGGTIQMYTIITSLLILPLAITLRSNERKGYLDIAKYTYIWFLYLLGRGLGMIMKISRSSK